jgi:hypothetical protein
MAWAENRAREKGVEFIGLYSRTMRTEAHGFYEGLGYAKDKESFFFKKEL